MFKSLTVTAVALLTSCCTVPVEALQYSFQTIGPEYIEYVNQDPRYDESEEGISEQEKQLRIERKEMRVRNVRMTQELLNELYK